MWCACERQREREIETERDRENEKERVRKGEGERCGRVILEEKKTMTKLWMMQYIFIIKGCRTTVFIFIVISATFRPIYPLAFFRCVSNSGTFTELRTTSFIESTGVF